MEPTSPRSVASSKSAGPSEPGRRRSRIKKWHGHQRTASLWDGLRKDDDLWDDNGDCLVFLHTAAGSNRGPCFKIAWSLLKEAYCMPLLAHSSPPNAQESPLATIDSKLADSTTALDMLDPAAAAAAAADGQAHGSADGSDPNTIEIHLTAPKGLSPRDTLGYHITSRNFFAWVCQKPLVGNSLSQALSDLLDRMKLYRAKHVENVEDLLIYADDLGYSHVECCADHALAMLCFAETHRISLVWTDAFAHCVGMNDELSASPEFEHISCVTRALITRASLEMDMHITRASRSLTDFLQDDLSSTHLGLALNARLHLDNFRQFLLSYHVEKHGCWPPSSDATFPKRIFTSMHADFQSLYDFLVDRSSEGSTDRSQIRLSLSGGVCLYQTLDQFNTRHGYHPLPHSLPLLPKQPGSARTSGTRSLRQFALQRSSQRNSAVFSDAGDLSRSSSGRSSAADRRSSTPNLLVQRYRQFEARTSLVNDGLPATEACKVRWLLIYCILQTVKSVLSAADGVRDCDAPYALCVLTTGLPPWKAEKAGEPETKLLQINTNVDCMEQRPVTATPLTPDDDAIESIKPLQTSPTHHRRSSSGQSLHKLASNSASLARSVTNMLSARRQSIHRSKGSRSSKGSISSVTSENTVINLNTDLKRPPSLPSGLFELGELGDATGALADTLEIEQLVPPPGADEEVVAQALARYAAERQGRHSSGPSVSAVDASFAFPHAATPAGQRSPVLEASHLDFSENDWQATCLDIDRLSSISLPIIDNNAIVVPDLQVDETIETEQIMASEQADSPSVQPATAAHERVEAYKPSHYDTLHLDSSPVETEFYESSEEPPSLNWSSNTDGSPAMRDSKEFDVMSLPSLDPATPSPGASRNMSLSQPKRQSSSLFSSLRSSRSFGSIYKFPEDGSTKPNRAAGAASKLSHATAYTNEAPLYNSQRTAAQETKIARQWSWGNQPNKLVETSWIADY